MLIDRPGAVQADLRLGGYAVDRTDPRWADLTVAGYAMGGAFLSRLNKVLREERGYTYGVRLGFSPLRSGGSYAVQGSFRTEVLVDAVARGPRAARRDRPALRRRPRWPTRWRTTSARHRCGSPPPTGSPTRPPSRCWPACRRTTSTPSLAALREVTPESATAAYASVVDAGSASLVVVGAADQLAEPLRALGYDDLVVIED